MENKNLIQIPELNNKKLIFDTHAHYDDEIFNDDRDLLLKKLNSSSVCNIINAGTNLQTSKISIDLADNYDFIFASVGIHPSYCDQISDDYINILKSYCINKKVVAIGEIGLDYHYDEYKKHIQLRIFEEQLKLANELSLPVIIHDREAHMDTLNLIKKYRPKGVIHCFSGSLEFANEVLKLGMYIGLGGVVTFKNANKITNVTKNIPVDRILLETDAPYMAPAPFRGKRCDSSMIIYSAMKIAELKQINTISLLEQTFENAKRLFF